MSGINASQAYIAIRKDNFVDGACFTQSEDTDRWITEMKDSGMRVEVRDRAEAKALLFTKITPYILLA